MAHREWGNLCGDFAHRNRGPGRLWRRPADSWKLLLFVNLSALIERINGKGDLPLIFSLLWINSMIVVLRAEPGCEIRL